MKKAGRVLTVVMLVQGDKVKFTLQFRGREMQFQEEGSKMFQVCNAANCL